MTVYTVAECAAPGIQEQATVWNVFHCTVVVVFEMCQESSAVRLAQIKEAAVRLEFYNLLVFV